MRQRLATPLLPDKAARCLCCLAVALLQACHSDGPDSPFKRYLNQLDLALPVAVAAVAPPLAAPALGQLQWPVSGSTLEELDPSQLRSCEVQANIRKRQTSLGYFAKPSQRLIMALEFLRLVPACIRQLRAASAHALADRLDAARREIQRELPERIFNATLGSEEYRAFWLATPAASNYPRSEASAAIAALQNINQLTQRWLNGDYRVHNLELELLLSAVAGGEGGQALARWSRQIHWLTATDQPIAQVLAATTSCSTQQRGAPSLRRIALAQRYFIDVIRPLTTEARDHYLKLTAPVEALEEQLERALAPRYHHWLTHRNHYAAALTSAPAQHLQQLENLIHKRQACAMPTVSAAN